MKTIIKNTAAALAAAMTLITAGCNKTETVSDTTASEAAVTDTASVSAADAHIYVEGTKFMADGKEIWFSGCNTPWFRWNDFDGNMDEAVWDKTFSDLAADHINCTRIWVNCNGDSIVNVDYDGEIDHVNDAHWSDLDKLFAIAEKYKVYVMPTLLSFDHFKHSDWQALLRSKEFCDQYAEMYVEEFCRRYGDCEYIMGVDIMNEPDWVFENEECGQISWDNISYLLGKCADTIHNNSRLLVTVGTAMIKYNSDQMDGNKVSDEYLQKLTGLDGAYLDFYSLHYYSWMRPMWGFPCGMTPEEYLLEADRPCMIGETSNDDEKDCGMTLTEKYKSMYDKGWNGLLVWMEPRKDEDPMWYRYDLTREATNALYEYIPDLIDPLGAWETLSDAA
ncbi:MAG: cellulase family glycosylhydrolase [Ruminiclostridium sp.]|nr:cellulase family glycosylhydrolase [Ruminiclostridium sp.]